MDDNSAISGDVQPSRRSIKYRHMSEKEKELPQLSFWELLKLNKPDWYFVVIGITMSALIAAMYPLLSIAFSEVLRVCIRLEQLYITTCTCMCMCCLFVCLFHST